MPFDWSLVQDAAYKLGQSHRGMGGAPDAQAEVTAHLDGLRKYLTEGQSSEPVTGEDVRAASEAFSKAYSQGLAGKPSIEGQEGEIGQIDANAPKSPGAQAQTADLDDTKKVFARVASYLKELAAKLTGKDRHHPQQAAASHERPQVPETAQSPNLPPGPGVFSVAKGKFSPVDRIANVEQKPVDVTSFAASSVDQGANAPAGMPRSSQISNASLQSPNTMIVGNQKIQELRQAVPAQVAHARR